jgi:WD40 repeat protein
MRARPFPLVRPTTVAFLLTAAVALARRPAIAGDGRAPFVVETNPFVLGQAMDWVDARHVVWQEPQSRDEDGTDDIHIYRSTLDGGEKVCLTCGLDGPNQVPVVQPRGRWILFHSWHGHTARLGSPGFGGIGSDVWVMTRDGAQATNLTNDAELHDNFHAYWSPDGRWIVWTSLSWNPADGGTGKSDVRVGRFDPHGPNGPRLVDVHVVRPANGHWYETQWWAPDGSGFLYTETYDTAINPELFFCRLPDPAYGACHPVRLTRDPAWDEQAIFTPDMARVIFMSSRGLPGAHNDWAQVATFLQLPADFDHVLVLPVFSDSYLQPVLQQATDLWETTLRWNAAHTRFKAGPLRRLTTTGEDGWVIPEFAWDPAGKRLLWTQNKFPATRRVDQGCIVRQIRASFVARLSAVQGLAQLGPALGTADDMRDEAVALLGKPSTYPFQGRGCGGDQPTPTGTFEQETRIGRFER